MSDWDDVLTSTAHLFTDTFGETVTYTKRNGTTRSITAVVSREQPAQVPGVPIAGASIRLSIANNATTGVVVTERQDGDTITVAAIRGGTARPYLLPARPVSQDAGMCVWEIKG